MLAVCCCPQDVSESSQSPNTNPFLSATDIFFLVILAGRSLKKQLKCNFCYFNRLCRTAPLCLSLGSPKGMFFLTLCISVYLLLPLPSSALSLILHFLISPTLFVSLFFYPLIFCCPYLFFWTYTWCCSSQWLGFPPTFRVSVAGCGGETLSFLCCQKYWNIQTQAIKEQSIRTGILIFAPLHGLLLICSWL